jgi:hypothetical protein
MIARFPASYASVLRVLKERPGMAPREIRQRLPKRRDGSEPAVFMVLGRMVGFGLLLRQGRSRDAHYLVSELGFDVLHAYDLLTGFRQRPPTRPQAGAATVLTATSVRRLATAPRRPRIPGTVARQFLL